MQQSNPIFTLKRFLPRLPDRTLGVLLDETGYPVCLTIERPWLDNKPMVSCFPLGEYPIIRVHSERFNMEIFQLQNVPNRTAVEIHKGNFFEDSEGCIILGEQFGMIQNKQGIMEYGVMVSGQAFEVFMAKLNGFNAAKLIVTES